MVMVQELIFVAGLTGAAERGVMVRVIVDAMGERYSKVTARAALAGSKVDIRHYLPLYKDRLSTCGTIANCLWWMVSGPLRAA